MSLNIRQKLTAIQQNLKAPKGQTNKFGGYKYRSAEDILNAVKPLCGEYQCTLIIEDQLIHTGDRYYVEATAILGDNDSDQAVSAQAYARECEAKKGMDEAQITGSASSYARKYALNGLFAIDDTKDPDATNTHGKTTQRVKTEPKNDDFL
tara:strand:- start:7358 stop:7810 length:453 start_codon:yes stop_codon:yes gene_type:complete